MPAHSPSENAPGKTSAPPLRILIAATPKTGNIWVKHILSAAYSLPIVEIANVEEDTVAALPARWIAHQHLSPTSAIIERLRRYGVIVITVFRHPCDVLVSFKAYLGRLGDAKERETHAADMLDDGETFGAKTLAYVRTEFATQINLSLLWSKAGAIVVRYEDLRRDPVSVMHALAARLGPVSERRLHAAIILNDLDRMRARHSKASFHFRKGGSGGWVELLPAEIVDTLRTLRPYPALFKALGYNLDHPADEPHQPSMVDAIDPFNGAVTFENGVRLCELVIRLFMISIPDALERWPEPARTSVADSYFAWLNDAAPSDPRRDSGAVRITNLMYAIYESRPDLQSAFPDVFGAHRLAFANWVMIYSRGEYDLDLVFLAPLFESIAAADAIE